MTIKFEDVKRKLLEDPATLKAYEDLQNEYQVASALIRARLKAHMTQAEVAKRMHTSQAAVARYEGGGYLPSLKTIEKYAQAVNQKISINISPRH